MVFMPAEKDTFSIGEVSQITGVKPYILRYWESAFGLVRPARRASGHRQFSRRDVQFISRVRELLYERRFTIEGAKKFLRREAREGTGTPGSESRALEETLKAVRTEVADILREMKTKLSSHLTGA
jgi:DNA-binding transcriptional MerR regulator